MKHIELSEFQIIGIAARTNNAKEASEQGIIGPQWQKFFQQGMLAKIPNKIDSKVYAVYTDYASDHTGDYTFVIGAAVKPGTNLPEGMVASTVPAGQYVVITSDKGPLPTVVPEAWQRMWKLEAERKLSRAYKSDLELYDERAADPQNGIIDLYVGVK